MYEDDRYKGEANSDWMLVGIPALGFILLGILYMIFR